jgi:hypothetical protein
VPEIPIVSGLLSLEKCFMTKRFIAMVSSMGRIFLEKGTSLLLRLMSFSSSLHFFTARVGGSSHLQGMLVGVANCL